MNKFPWLRVWMLVFSIGGIWMIVGTLGTTEFTGLGASLDYWLALPILLAIALAALWKMPMPFSTEPEEDSVVASLGRLYLDSWRALVRMRWLLILVGGIALIGIADGLTQYLLSIHYGANDFFAARRLGGAAPGGFHALEIALSTLPHEVADTPRLFFPSFGAYGHSGRGLILPLAILALIPWVSQRLRRLSGDPRYRGTVRVIRIMFIPTAAIALTTPLATHLYWVQMWAQLTARATHTSIPHFSSEVMWRYSACTVAWGLLTSAFVAPFVLAGLAGSLRRLAEGGQTSGDTFVEDAVRRLKPFVGLFLTLLAVEAVLGVPSFIGSAMAPGSVPEWVGVYAMLFTFAIGLLLALIMFVLYAIVSRDIGTFQALRFGIADWLSNAGLVVSFMAVGISIIVPIELLHEAAAAMTRELSGWGLAVHIVYLPVGAMMSAWLAVSVWELYRRIGKPAITASGNG